jgi:hypothetical protein
MRCKGHLLSKGKATYGQWGTPKRMIQGRVCNPKSAGKRNLKGKTTPLGGRQSAGGNTKPRGENPTKPIPSVKNGERKDAQTSQTSQSSSNTNSNSGRPISRAVPGVQTKTKVVPRAMADVFSADPELSVKVDIKDDDDSSNPTTPSEKGSKGASGSTLRNRKANHEVKDRGDGNVPKGKDQGKKRGNVNFLQMAASLVSVMDRVTSFIPLFGGDGPRDPIPAPVADPDEEAPEDAKADDDEFKLPNFHEDPEPELLRLAEEEYLENHPKGEHPIFRAEIGEDVRKPIDYAPELEKFNIRSEWRRSILAPSFRSDVGYVELPTGIVDEALSWMQTHWKKWPTPEERTILMQELNSTCQMLLRKFNIRPVLSRARDGVLRHFVNPDFSHQVHGLGALAIDVGEPLFFASQHPIPIFHLGWPLASFITFIMLVIIVSISPYTSLAIVLPLVLSLLFFLWVFGSLSVSKNRHWYYYAFSPELRFQFGSRR